MKTIILHLVLSLLFFADCTVSAQTLFWTVNSKEAVLKGDSRGVAIDDTGRITLAPRVTGGYSTGEQFIWSSAADKSGNVYLGTGGNGRVIKVTAAGKGTVLFDSEEINVTAVAMAPDGSVLAATSPDGKVYRIDKNGRSSVYFEPKTKYIWSLAVTPDGGLFVGTGETGRIYRVTKAGAKVEESLFYDSRETHIICLATDKIGNLYAGTDASGLVLRIGANRKAFAILDSSLREIHEVSIGPDGSVYALALSESVSVKKPKTPDPNDKQDKTVSVERPNPAAPPAPATPEKSRYDLTGSKSVVYRVLPDGTGDIIWNSDSVPAFSISADPAGGGVFVGTSDKGRIFRISDSARESLLIQTEEEQISTLLKVGNMMVATTSNKGHTFRFGPEPVNTGSYESPVLDAASTARWGRIWTQNTNGLTLETRSGNSALPAATWSEWVAAAQTDGKIASPPARYFQWRALLNSPNPVSVRETTVSFAAVNIAPEVLSIEILPANVGLAPNPEVPVDPNIQTLGLNPADFGLAIAAVPPRKVFQSGARSIQWKGTDRNGDKLSYRVFLRKTNETSFRQIGGATYSEFMTLDGMTMDDGRYVVKIVAEDSRSNVGADAKSGERISESFEIDNSPPTVEVVGDPTPTGNQVVVRFRANESSSYIKRAEFNINGGKWFPVHPDDGIVDGKSESFTVNVNLKNADKFVIAIRVFDAVGNIGSARIVK